MTHTTTFRVRVVTATLTSTLHVLNRSGMRLRSGNKYVNGSRPGNRCLSFDGPVLGKVSDREKEVEDNRFWEIS